MPTIVNQSFFIGDLYLPNLTHSAELARLQGFIDKYEPECLLNILGYPLYKLIGVESSTRMTELLTGGDYTDGMGNLQKWQGITHNTVISLIANYVYWYILKSDAINKSGVGTNISKSEAATEISPAEKMCEAWNFFSSEVSDMCSFLWLKKDGSNIRVYTEFSYYQFCETRRISRKVDSVFQF